MIRNKNTTVHAAKCLAFLCAASLFIAPSAHAYFDTLPPIRVIVPPTVGGITIVEPPVVVPPVVIPPPVVVVPPGGGTPPAVHGTPEPATLLLGLSAAGIASFMARRRK
jgi:PEP-CTERM motif